VARRGQRNGPKGARTYHKGHVLSRRCAKREITCLKRVTTKTGLSDDIGVTRFRGAEARRIFHKLNYFMCLRSLLSSLLTSGSSEKVDLLCHCVPLCATSLFSGCRDVVTPCLGGELSRRRLSVRKEDVLLEKGSLSERRMSALVGSRRESEIVGRRTGEVAEVCEKGRRNGRRREFTLSASPVNCWGGRSAPDRQAPRTGRSSNFSLFSAPIPPE
jgi:hypothetical protein